MVFEKINKIYKPLSRLWRKRREKEKEKKKEDSNKTRDGRGGMTTDATEVKIMRQSWTIIHQQTEQPIRSVLISETYNLLRRNRKLEQWQVWRLNQLSKISQ